MEVILLKDHQALGEIGDIVNVKPGYARNFLFPQGIAVRSSKRNVALAEEQKKTAQKRASRENKANEELLAQLKKVEISIEVEVGEEDKLFGSVTNLDIHKALEENGIIAFDSIGNEFDPELHEALMSQESEEEDEGIILNEFEKGYKFHDKILRHAKVVVSKAKQEA